MARFDISLIGDNELSAALAGLTDKLERRVLSQALRAAAKTVLVEAQNRVTCQARLPAGAGKRLTRRLQRDARQASRLRNSLKIRALRRSRRRIGYGVYAGSRTELGIRDGYYYPIHLELGHGPPRGRVRGLRGTRLMRRHASGGRTPAHPFLRPSLKNNEQRLLAQLAQDIGQGIEREAGRQ